MFHSALLLRSHIQAATEKQGFTSCKDILIYNRVELQSMLDLCIQGASFAAAPGTPLYFLLIMAVDWQDVDCLLDSVCSHVTPKPTTALEILHRRNRERDHLPTGLPHLDSLLSGGLPSGTITEFTGPAGAGKTQFCITMSVIAAQRGEGVVYIVQRSRRGRLRATGYPE